MTKLVNIEGTNIKYDIYLVIFLNWFLGLAGLFLRYSMLCTFQLVLSKALKLLFMIAYFSCILSFF